MDLIFMKLRVGVLSRVDIGMRMMGVLSYWILWVSLILDVWRGVEMDRSDDMLYCCLW